MALTYISTDGNVVIPGAPARWDTAPSNSGVATSGVVVLVGEADVGPDFTTEPDIAQNRFGPRQYAAVVAKYGSGRIVDAFRAVTAPSKDNDVKGSPALVYIIKTNKGAKAQATLSGYATLQAKQEGTLGNLISVAVTTGIGGQVKVTVQRKADNISEQYTIGAHTALTIGSATASACPVIVSGTGLTAVGVGGDPAALNISFSDFKTLGDLAAYISAQQGWTATVLPAYRHLPPTVLDAGTYETKTGSNAAIKKDAQEFIDALNSSRLVTVSVEPEPKTGLPTVAALPTYLSGGLKGATSNADVQAALDAAGLVRCNFVCTLFSQDATADIALGETQSAPTASGYDIASVNAALSDHVSRFSQFKRRRARQGFGSFRGSFAAAKAASQNTANFRVAMQFLDVNVLGQRGLTWFQPWMLGVVEAGMQAAAFYRPCFGKGLNINGVRQATDDFKTQDDDAVEDALLAGLTVARERDGGGFELVSDGTTYGTDQNFVFNSVQAVYVADLVAATVSQRMERGFKGQSFADVSAAVAMSFLKNIMADLKRKKLICASKDALSGYKNANIEIAAPSMLVGVEAKLASGLYFIPISILVSEVVDSASA